MNAVIKPDDDLIVLSYMPPAVPGMGALPINAFLLMGPEPVLIDTGAIIDRDRFLAALRSVIDPGSIRSVFLTHEDIDHAGNLGPVLDLAPRARLALNFVGFAKLSAKVGLDPTRVWPRP